jgi:ABC-type multidrug transport system permease subunit
MEQMSQIMLVSEIVAFFFLFFSSTQIVQIQYLIEAIIFGFASHFLGLEEQPIQGTLYNFLGVRRQLGCLESLDLNFIWDLGHLKGGF